MEYLKENAMIRLMKASLTMFVLLLLASLSAEAQVVSNTTFQIHQPMVQTIYDVCTGVNVDLSGEYFYEYQFVQMSNGDTHLNWTSHYNLVGMEGGIKYIGKDQQKYDVRTDPDGFPPQPTSDFHTSDKFKLIAQGKAPDMTIQSFQHIKIDKNNNVVVDKEKDPIVKCK